MHGWMLMYGDAVGATELLPTPNAAADRKQYADGFK
jgi:hypothetical protein